MFKQHLLKSIQNLIGYLDKGLVLTGVGIETIQVNVYWRENGKDFSGLYIDCFNPMKQQLEAI